MHNITTMELIPMVEPIPPLNRLRIRLFLSLESPWNRLRKIWNRNTSSLVQPEWKDCSVTQYCSSELTLILFVCPSLPGLMRDKHINWIHWSNTNPIITVVYQQSICHDARWRRLNGCRVPRGSVLRVLPDGPATRRERDGRGVAQLPRRLPGKLQLPLVASD